MASLGVKNLFFYLKDWPSFFLCFVGLGFVAPSVPFWALCFYLFFIPRFLFELYQQRKFYRVEPLFLPLFFLELCFLWVGSISCFWSLVGHQNWKWLVDFTCTMLFLLGTWEAMQQSPKFFKKIIYVFAFGGSVNAFIALCLRFFGKNIDSYAPTRIAGFSVFHPIVFAGDLAGLSLLSLVFILFFHFSEKKKIQKRDILYLFLLGFNGFFLFLTGCRTAWGALFVAFLMFLNWQKRLIFLGAFGLLSMGFLLFPKMLTYFFARTDSGHLEIWEKTFAYFSPYFICGEGMQMKMPIPNGTGGFFAHPHSFYLSLWAQGGAIGSLFFILSGASLFALGLKSQKACKILAFALYALLCGLTDLSFVFKGPSEEWILIWLPFLITIFCLWKESVKSPLT